MPLGAAPVPVRLPADDLAELTIVDTLHQFLVLWLPPLLRPDHDRELLLVGQIGGRQQRPHTHGVDGPGFLHEDVLARFHGGPQRHRTKAGRRQEQHGIHFLHGHHLLVGIEADEAGLGRHLDLLGHRLLHSLQRVFEPVGQQLGQGHHLHAGGRLEAVNRVFCPPIAAADHGDADFIGTGGKCPAARRQQDPRRYGGARLQQVPAGKRRFSGFS